MFCILVHSEVKRTCEWCVVGNNSIFQSSLLIITLSNLLFFIRPFLIFYVGGETLFNCQGGGAVLLLSAVSPISVSRLMSQIFSYHLESFKLINLGDALINLTYWGQRSPLWVVLPTNEAVVMSKRGIVCEQAEMDSLTCFDEYFYSGVEVA